MLCHKKGPDATNDTPEKGAGWDKWDTGKKGGRRSLAKGGVAWSRVTYGDFGVRDLRKWCPVDSCF